MSIESKLLKIYKNSNYSEIYSEIEIEKYYKYIYLYQLFLNKYLENEYKLSDFEKYIKQNFDYIIPIGCSKCNYYGIFNIFSFLFCNNLLFVDRLSEKEKKELLSYNVSDYSDNIKEFIKKTIKKVIIFDNELDEKDIVISFDEQFNLSIDLKLFYYFDYSFYKDKTLLIGNMQTAVDLFKINTISNNENKLPININLKEIFKN